MTRLAILTGGSTPERYVAFAGAAQVVAALRGHGHSVSVIDTVTGALTPEAERRLLVASVGRQPPTPEELHQLELEERWTHLADLEGITHAELVFLVLHGRQGEGGAVQALLQLAGVVYTGSGPLGSALAMDKDVAKRLLAWANIPTPAWTMWPASEAAIERLGMPLVVKPSNVGSTVGLTVIHDREDLAAAVAHASQYDDDVMLERYVPGRELTVGILDDEALAVGEIIPQHDIFDYECKYTPGMSREIFPAELPPSVTDRVRALGLAVHRALKLRDFSRVDFRLDPEGIPWCLEANTLPGLTATSLLPQSAAAVGVGFAELCERICRAALRRTGFRNKV